MAMHLFISEIGRISVQWLLDKDNDLEWVNRSQIKFSSIKKSILKINYNGKLK